MTSRKTTVAVIGLLIVLHASLAGAQTYTVSPTPFQTAFDNSGNIINNSCVWTYSAGTTTPATTYSDNAGTPNANPIRSDSAGRFTVYLVSGTSYKFVYESACTPPSHGTTLRTADNILATPTTANPTTTLDTVNLRMTLTSGTPVTTADVTAATTIYIEPFHGARVALYDGSSWNMRTVTAASVAVPASTSQMYDMWVRDVATVPTYDYSAWSGDTSRGYTLSKVDGVYVNPLDFTRRYIGSFRTTGVSGQTEDSAAKRYLWNYYNRVRRSLRITEATDSWTYTTDTFRQANNSTANQVDVVVGVDEVLVSLRVEALATNSTGSVLVAVGIGYDSTSAAATGCLMTPASAANTTVLFPFASLDHYPAVGRHTYAWLERSVATGTTSWFGDNGAPTKTQSGLSGFHEG
jgi:hypothetical protein